jgi:hypothetical protein
MLGVVLPREEEDLALLSAEDSRVSTETESLVIDPLQLPAVDSPQEGPPSKIARRESSLGEKEPSKEVGQGQELEMATLGGAATSLAGQDLQKEALASMPLAQGRRSQAVPYSRRGAVPPTPSTATRKSTRNGGGKTGASTIGKAQRLAAEKNLEGKCKESGTSAEVLGFLSDSHLSEVILDSGMAFRPSAGTTAEALSLIRAKEKVQAALAATARRLELEAEARAAQALAQAEAGGVSVALSEDAGLAPSGEGVADVGEPTAPTAPRAGSPGFGPDLGLDGAAGTSQRSPDRFGDEEAQGTKPRRRKGRKSNLTVRKGSSKRKTAP